MTTPSQHIEEMVNVFLDRYIKESDRHNASVSLSGIITTHAAIVEAETVEKCARVAAELPYNPEHEKRIKQILVEGQGWIYAEQQIEHHNDPKQPYGTYRTERNPIEIFQVNGEMASVNWYRQGNREYNGKFVVVVEYFDGV